MTFAAPVAAASDAGGGDVDTDDSSDHEGAGCGVYASNPQWCVGGGYSSDDRGEDRKDDDSGAACATVAVALGEKGALDDIGGVPVRVVDTGEPIVVEQRPTDRDAEAKDKNAPPLSRGRLCLRRLLRCCCCCCFFIVLPVLGTGYYYTSGAADPKHTPSEGDAISVTTANDFFFVNGGNGTNGTNATVRWIHPNMSWVTVFAHGFRNQRGVAKMWVHNDKDEWNEDRNDWDEEDGAYLVRHTHITRGNNATFEFNTTDAPGYFGVFVLHDKDEDGDMKTNWLGVPREGCGCSNGASGGPSGGPKWRDAKFWLPARSVVHVPVEMWYS